MMTDSPLLSMRNVRKRYGPTIALDGVDLEVAAGEIHAVIGENGAGKSTLMKTLCGVVEPDSGEITLDTHPIPRQDRPTRSAMAQSRS